MNTKLRYIVVLFVVTLAFVWCIPSMGQVVKGSTSGSGTAAHGAAASNAEVKANNVKRRVVCTTTAYVGERSRLEDVSSIFLAVGVVLAMVSVVMFAIVLFARISTKHFM